MQTAEKLKIIKNFASAGDQGDPESIDVYIIADWAAKRAGHKKNTKQADGFGHAGNQCAWFRACVAAGSTAMSSKCARGTEGGVCGGRVRSECCVCPPSEGATNPRQQPPARAGHRLHADRADPRPAAAHLSRELRRQRGKLGEDRRAAPPQSRTRGPAVPGTSSGSAGEVVDGREHTQKLALAGDWLFGGGGLEVAAGKRSRRQRSSEEERGKGVVLSKNGPCWCVDFGAGEPPAFWAFHAKSLELTADDPLHGQPTHDGRPDRKEKAKQIQT